jgi:hypothetical protein
VDDDAVLVLTAAADDNRVPLKHDVATLVENVHVRVA